MAEKKLTTAEILARARAQSKGEAPAPASSTPAPESAPQPAPGEAAETPAEAAPAKSPPAKPAPSAKPAGGAKPKSTADILAAARAQSAGKSAEGAGDAPKPAAAKPAAAKPAGGAPKSTADILAAARAQTGKGDAATPAAPKASAGAKAAQPAAAPAGELPSVQEMIRAVREGKTKPEAAEAPESKKPELPPRPQKPVVAAKGGKGAKEEVSRRGALAALVLSPFAAAWTMLGVASGAALLGCARFMMPNVLVEPPSRFKIGPKGDYPFGTVSTKWKAEYGVAIIHTNFGGQNVLYALSTVCTHLGCTPNWLDSEQKFKCPCHGSGFYMNGINFEGPAPRPLERVGLSLAADGMLEVDKSLKFQEEMGQWVDPASFVPA